MFTKNLSLFFPLLFLLHTFLNFNAVSAVSLQFQRRSLSVDMGALNTNAKRLAAGAPPISPTKRWVPSKVARDPQPSSVPVTRVIRVDLNNGVTIGYVSQSLQDGHYSLATFPNAGHFSTTIKSSGETVDINLKNQNSNLFLAGIIQSGVNLRNNNAAFARIGESQATNSNDIPQSGKSPSLPGDAETAIWKFSSTGESLEAQWVNYNNGKANRVIMYDSATNTFYITSDPTGVAAAHSLAVVVKFFFV